MATEPPPFTPTPPPVPPHALPPTTGMVARIKAILLTPGTEWDRIDAEPMTEKSIYTGWVIPLAAIPAVAGFIGGQLFGLGAFGIVYKPPIVSALVTAILTLVMAVVGVWVVAKIVDALAPNFNAVKNPIAATKVVAFSYTASWVAGILQIIPALALLAVIGGLYSLYLLYLGLPKLMKAPADKALGYTVVIVLCAIVLSIVIGAVVGTLAMTAARPAFSADAGTVSGTIAVPGVAAVDLGKLDAASKQMAASAAQIQASAAGAAAPAGAVQPVAAGVLAAMLPTAAAGWNRTSIESSSGAAGGIGGSKAEGAYSQGDGSARLSVTDMAAMGALAAMGSALNVESSKETATGYEKVGKVGGRMTTEEWDSSGHSGKYSTIVANRFVVEAEGNAASMEALKALVGSVDLGRLEGLAK